MQVQEIALDQLLENERDVFVRPQTSRIVCQRCPCGSYNLMLLQLFSVRDDRHALTNLRMILLQRFDCPHYGLQKLARPKGEAAGHGAPFTGDVVLGDIGTDSVVVFELELSDLGRAVEEQWLAVAAILQ